MSWSKLLDKFDARKKKSAEVVAFLQKEPRAAILGQNSYALP